MSKPTLYRYMKQETDFPPHTMENGYTWFERAAVEKWKAERSGENPGQTP